MSTTKLNKLSLISKSEYNRPRFNGNFKDIYIVDNSVIRCVGNLGVLDIVDLPQIYSEYRVSNSDVDFILYSSKVTILILNNHCAIHISKSGEQYQYRFTSKPDHTWVMLQNFFYLDNPRAITNVKKQANITTDTYSIDAILKQYNRSSVVPYRESNNEDK